MPIQIDPVTAKDLAPRFDEALEIVRNEFVGLDSHRQYRNAFARLLKADPLRRVLMMGTDQRDLFIPMLRRVIADVVPRKGHIFDFGAGDGQTFALVADAAPEGTVVSIEEPNPDYVADYSAFLRSQPHLRAGLALVAEYEELEEAAKRAGVPLPADGSVDLGLALHMVFFLRDLPAGLTRMARFLKPGGALFTVVADETDGYTGLVLKAFIEAGGDSGDNARHLAAIAERRHLLASAEQGGGAIVDELRSAGIAAELEATYQSSRLYGHCLSDLIVLSTISVLSEIESVAKFEVATDLLRREPEAADLRIEDEGPRKGMWSVTQPQWVSLITRKP